MPVHSGVGYSYGTFTEEELSGMTVKQIKELVAEYGYTITKTVKADIIDEFMEQQG